MGRSNLLLKCVIGVRNNAAHYSLCSPTKRLVFGILLLVLLKSDVVNAQDNRIVDFSHDTTKAVTRSHSSYGLKELNDLPIIRRLSGRILVHEGWPRDRYEAILRTAVDQMRAKQPEIDSIVLFAYDREKDAKDGERPILLVVSNGSQGMKLLLELRLVTTDLTTST